MDGFGYQFFSDPCFAGDKNPGIGVRHLFDEGIDSLHFMIFADNVSESVFFIDFSSEVPNFLQHLSFSNCLFDDHEQGFRLERLLKIIGCAVLNGCNR